MSWLYRSSKKIFYQEIFPLPRVNLHGVDLLTFTRCSMQLSLYVGYGWIYVKCQLQSLWMQYFLNDKDESSQFSPWYMFCDCFWPHRRTIQGWRSFSAQPECPFSFFLAGRRMSTSYCGGPRGARPVPIINVFKPFKFSSSCTDYQCFQVGQWTT